MSTKTFELKYITADEKAGTVGVIIVAAGSSSRMGGINKMLTPILGEPVIRHTITVFNSCAEIADIVLVTREDMILELQRMADECGFLKVSDIITGGNCREESVKKGFERLIQNKNIKTVLIHDGARPLVSNEVIGRVIKATEEFSATVPCVGVKDTIKRVGSLGKVEQTIDRTNLVNIQTPQGFSVSLLSEAFEKAGEDLSHFTDDASVVENANHSVYTVEGDYKNIKITTSDDLILAEAYLKAIRGGY